MQRSTVVVPGRLLLDAVTVSHARAGSGSGLQVLPVAAVAARLAGGFLRLVDPDRLLLAVGEALSAESGVDLGDLHALHDLPGLRGTLAASLDLAWSAGFDLAAHADRHPRIAALARLEEAVLATLPPSQCRPDDLANLAIAQIGSAPRVLGPVTFRGLADLARCWRGLAARLAEVVSVSWDAGPMPTPAWLSGTAITVVEAPKQTPTTHLVSCAFARHEVVEAMRWARGLLASGTARPQDIAFAAASTSFFDDYVLSAAEEASLPIHFAHGRGALHTQHGQTAAALADVLLRGLSQERVQRLVARISGDGLPLAKLPGDWRAALPSDAPLRTAEHWRLALGAAGRDDVAPILMPVIEMLSGGPDMAGEAGERLLRGPARDLWRRALAAAPGSALEHTLSRLRSSDPCDPQASIAWMPAETLAGCPRPFVWLMGLNAQEWPRASREDPLLPEHVLDGFVLQETSLAQADRRSFEAILASTAREVTCSFSRREIGGRKLGVSALVDERQAEERLRSRPPAHAMSEPDRMLARPEEFGLTAAAIQANACWSAWRSPDIGPHDGRVRPMHPAILRALDRRQSASSLQLLLRNPVAFMWRYALGLQAPDLDQDPMELDALQFGELVHDILDRTVIELERTNVGLGQATAETVADCVSHAVAAAAADWEIAQPTPPGLLWSLTLQRAEAMVLNGLLHPFEALEGQRSFSELPFGDDTPPPPGKRLPEKWDSAAPVLIPGTGLCIGGRIDRLDVAADKATARVVDYKTGGDPGDIILRGGREVQRCLYALAVRALIGDVQEIETALLFPSRERGGMADNEYKPLEDPDATLTLLSGALLTACQNLRDGLALPGVAAGLRYRDTRNLRDNRHNETDSYGFALPVVPGTMLEPKKVVARAELGPTIADFWDAP